MVENFKNFVLRHRFRPREIIPGRQQTLHDFELTRAFPGWEIFRFFDSTKELRKLKLSLMLANHMAQYATDEPALFSQFVSELDDHEWSFSLRFCPFHKVKMATENLELIHSAMKETCLGANAAMAGMESAIDHFNDDRAIHARETSKATIHLLNFAALYASYVDVCRRIRGHCSLAGVSSYDRAIKKILGQNIGAHGFIKDLRNFLLHYHIVEPSLSIVYGEHRKVNLLLSSAPLLYSGFDWKRGSRDFLQSNDKVDIVHTLKIVTKDVGRLVNFHSKLVEKRLSKMKFAYDTYLNERLRHNHLHAAIVDIGAVFNLPQPLTSRLLEKSCIESVLHSALGDDEALSLLMNFANKHKNLPDSTMSSLENEIRILLEKRPRFPVGEPYLQGRKFE